MKKLKNVMLKKIMPVFLLIILLFNFVMPNYVYGSWIGGVLTRGLESLGGLLLGLVADLTRGLCDTIIKLLQDMFVTTYDTDIIFLSGAQIRYGPALIFSGNVPGLDINFIEPAENQKKLRFLDPDVNGFDTTTWSDTYLNGDEEISWATHVMSVLPNVYIIAYEHQWGFWNGATWTYDFSDSEDTNAQAMLQRLGDDMKSISKKRCDTSFEVDNNAKIDSLINEIKNKKHFTVDELKQVMEQNKTLIASISLKARKNNENGETEMMILRLRVMQPRKTGDVAMFIDISTPEYGNNVEETGEEFKSVSKILQPTVSKWYKGTRLISTVGLLSVLLYVGIRIILSSTAGDKAKYKKMLMDWLTALCILFILHYLMVFILNTSKQITGIFSNYMKNANGNYGEKLEIGAVDTLMSTIRDYAENGNGYERVANTVMYASLVMLTVTFTFQYLRRVLYMAFLTMIAPLIALTYPIDKVKDGQAQAFSMWIREYIFNALIQPIHFIIYVMLVGSAIDLIEVSKLYAIVAISFIVPAEKFIRKMFGFEKASTVGQLGAAAGGAMIMNMINKAKGMGGKSHGGLDKEGGGSSASKGVRTPTKFEPLASIQGGVQGSSGEQRQEQSAGSQPSARDIENGYNSGYDEAGSNAYVPRNNGNPSSYSQADTPGLRGGASLTSLNPIAAKKAGTFKKLLRGAGSGGKYVLKKHGLWGADLGRKMLKAPVRATASAVGAATLGMIGVSAGIATGELGNALKYGGAGLVAGNALGKGVSNTIAGDVEGFFKEGFRGYNGNETYQNMQFEKQFFAGNEYKALTQKYGRQEAKRYSRAFLDHGITDTSKMDVAMSKGLSPEDAVAFATIAKNCPAGTLHDLGKFREFLLNRNVNIPNDEAGKRMLKEYYDYTNLFT